MELEHDAIEARLLERMAARDQAVIAGAFLCTALLTATTLRNSPWFLTGLFLAVRAVATTSNHRRARELLALGGRAAQEAGYVQRMERTMFWTGVSYGAYCVFINGADLDDRAVWVGVLTLVAATTVMANVGSFSPRGAALYATGTWIPIAGRLLFLNTMEAYLFAMIMVLFVAFIGAYGARMHQMAWDAVSNELTNERLLVSLQEAQVRDQRNRDSLAELNAQLEQALLQAKELASRDFLTGTLNRRAFEEKTGEVLGKQSTGCVLLIDFDDFKEVNDRFGHSVGDVVLARGAACMEEVLRPSDVLARWGGEEFIVLLPGANIAAAVEIGDRLRLAIEQRLAESVKEHVEVASDEFVVTVSVGLAVLTPTRSFKDVLVAADTALYEAKSGGRNRLVLAPE